MFDRNTLGAVVLTSSLLSAAPLLAQAKHADSTLEQRWMAARSRAERLHAEGYRRDAIARAVQPPNSIVEGVITILYDSSKMASGMQAALRKGARLATDEITAVEREGARRTIGPMRFVAMPVHLQYDPRAVIGLTTTGAIVDPDHHSGFTVPSNRWAIAQYFRTTAAVRATALVSAEVWRWITPAVPPEALTKSDWTRVAEWVFAAQSETVTRCVNGSSAACATSLEIEPPADKLAAFYGPRDYPSLVERYGVQAHDPDSVAATVKLCIRANDPSACARSVTRVPVGGPIPAQARQSLVALALEMGGPKALDRLLDGTGSTRERLASVAGVSADSLLQLWRIRVQASRPEHNLAPVGFAAIGWMLVLALVTLRRPRCA
jgi:hypothetical protein